MVADGARAQQCTKNSGKRDKGELNGIRAATPVLREVGELDSDACHHEQAIPFETEHFVVGPTLVTIQLQGVPLQGCDGSYVLVHCTSDTICQLGGKGKGERRRGGGEGGWVGQRER